MKRFDFSELNVSESGTVTSICLDIAFDGKWWLLPAQNDPKSTWQTAMQARLKAGEGLLRRSAVKCVGCQTTYKQWTTYKSQVHREPTYLGVYGTMVVQMWNDATLGIRLWIQNSYVTCFSVPRDWGQKPVSSVTRRKNLITQENCYVDQLLIFKTIWLAAPTHKHFILRFDVFVLPGGIRSKDRDERSRIFPKLAKERVCNATVE